MNQTAKGAPVATVILIGLLWGLNWPAVKYMLTGLPPITIRAVALTLGSLLLAAIVRARGLPLRPAPGERWAIVYTGLPMIFGFNVLTSFGQIVTETSKAAIIAFTMPAFTALFAHLLIGERMTGRSLAALVFGMAGLCVLAAENLDALIAAPAGPVIMLGAAISWAIGTVALKAHRWSLPPLSLTVWFLAVSAAACWPLVLLFEEPWRLTWPPAPIAWTMAYHILGPMVICYALWTSLVGRISATVSAIATLMVPVVGVLSAVMLLGDALTWYKVVSLATILASIALTLDISGNRFKPARYRE